MATPQFAPVPRPETDVPASLSFDADNEPPLRWQRAVHLAPQHGLGVGRRAIFFALVCWLPIAIWALVRGRFLHAQVGEPLLQHYGVHVRCLVAIPLLILGEATLHLAQQRYLPAFIRNGIVDDALRPTFDAVLKSARRWADASMPWLLAVGVAVAWALVERIGNVPDEMSWAFDAGGSIGFGGFWFAYLVRPVFVALLLGWLWRIVRLTITFARLARLGLTLVPTHPDRVGGLGFIEKLPGVAFAPAGLAISATIASRWAHQIVQHGQTLAGLKFPAATFVVAWSLLLVVPLVPWVPVLNKARRTALESYAALLAAQGRLVRQRWIDGSAKTDSPLIEPSGVGVLADAASMFNAVVAMRRFPVSSMSIGAILVPIAVPMLAVVALQVPLKNLLAGLLKALI